MTLAASRPKCPTGSAGPLRHRAVSKAKRGKRRRERAGRMTGAGRVGMWRGGRRFGLSVAAPFVWRCPSNLAVAPFPHPAHRTGHADHPHPALGQNFTPSLSPSHTPARGQTYEPEVPVQVREWIAPTLAVPNLVLVA